jgi:S1-C subfamily serine protease
LSPEPLIHGRRKKALVAAGAAAVLLAGYLLAPPRPMRPPSEERVAPILEEELEARDPIRLLRGAQETGRRVSAFVVEVRPRAAAAAHDVVRDVALDEARREPGGFGLLLDGGRVVTHLDALDGDLEPTVTTDAAGGGPARVLAADAASGLALVQLGGEAPPAAAVGAQTPEAGTPALAAARPGGVALVAALIIASADDERLTLSAASGITRPGTPVFSTAGEALAIAAGPRDPSAAYRIAPALARMKGRTGGAGASSLGLAFQEPSDRLSAVLGEGGVPIADVRAGSPGAAAGLRAGDVLVSVDGAAVATADAARAAISGLAPGADAALEVRRGERTLDVAARPVLWRPPARRAAADAGGIPARDLLAPETLDALGLPPETRVLAVDGGAPPTGPRAVAAWRRRREPAVVQVSTPSGRRLVAVEPAR